MSEQENTQIDVQNEDQIEVEVVESENVASDTVTTDEDLTKESKNVQKRINKKNQQIMAAEQRVAKLQEELAQKTQEAKSYYDQVLASRSEALDKQEEAHKAKQIQADEIYKKAIESNDAELISKADTLKSELAIEKEKIRIAKKNAVQPKEETQQTVVQEQYQPQPQPTREAIKWHEKNSWYGDASNEDNIQATQFAYFTHNALINEGYEADSNEYYNELDNRVYKVYPNLRLDNDDKSESQPPVQRVASASVGGRQKTHSKKNGVTFTKSEVERLKGLKPHNMTEESWLKSVAKEKQKIAQREAK